MKLNLLATASSFFLHAMVVSGIFLYCQSSESPRITSAEYLTVTVVDMVSGSFETQKGSASDSMSQRSIPSTQPPVKPVPKIFIKLEKLSPLKLVTGKQKIKNHTEATKSLKQKKNEVISSVVSVKKKTPSSNRAYKTELYPAQTKDGLIKTKVVGQGSDSTVQMNFNHIRKTISRNLFFPTSARKRRLCGTIEVSFLVGTDGEVADIRITSSSGHSLLDRNVIAAVRRSAPFPASPALARIVLPIVFRLK